MPNVASFHDATTSQRRLSAKDSGVIVLNESRFDMKAVYVKRYGSPSDLQVGDVPTPALHDSRKHRANVLIRVHAAGLHVGDCFSVRGAPFVVRMETGWLRPTTGIPGYDFSGVVEEVGESADGFDVGDEVFGYCLGSCAEFVAVADDKLARKPQGLSFVEAAALPTSGLAALHALRDVANLQAGQSLLINGASGGVGTFAVQIAKAFGVEVTGICSGLNAALVQSLGADHVVDYNREDFTDAGQQFDCILDNVENRKLYEIRRALKPTGTLICNSGTGASGVAFWVRLLKPLIVSPFTTQRLCRYLSVPTRQDLEVLSEMVNDKKLKPVLSEVHTLDSVADALHMLESGRTVGKRVVRVIET
ncbi:NAD(P)-dependent alcohol dehydrogenase [Stieleria varia]|uniref:Phenolphthiocerol synthesis polyketide synthase type I Pks15/1 n=1 Tax=Stieleria varia TaxID=2528005 RepID=A0A5C6B2X0_9BACT|nr:NAD(P)-dependent alcohol dehydrogenase [Stieleria varia]TWU04794.1 Phenolphthiocerol synthesis polyketide synthase type I Pks15/1 [Stieleria varia]